MSHEQSIQFLRIVSMIGMIAFNVMATALVYWKLEFYYPDKVKKNKWLFSLVAVLMSFLMLFIFNKIYLKTRL